MQPSPILFSKTDGALRPAPIHAHWILDGKPEARNRILSYSRDRTAVTVVWDCTAGAFNWFYDSEETIHVLEGSARLTTVSGVQTIGPGSVVVFQAGSQARWDIDCYIRKFAIFRQPVPPALSISMRGWKRLRSMLAGEYGQRSPALAGA